MKLTKKYINTVTFILVAINIFTNIWWVLHQDADHRFLVFINIIVAILLGGIVAYTIRNK